MNKYSHTELKAISPITWSIGFAYALLLVYFGVVDVYHQYFFATGLTVVVYNFARLFFVCCFMWLLYVPGDWLLRSLSGPEYIKSTRLESALLAFFVGCGCWQISFLVVGLAGFYNRLFISIITLAIFLVSLPRLDTWSRYLISSRKKFYWPGWLVLVLPVTFFLITKGLYPAGGHDYYNHYFHFYRKVVDTGSVLPNEIWYQFYYVKGAALFFISMLLTDPLAPQLTTTAMMFAGAAMVFCILKNSKSWRMLPWLGAALYFAFLIYTPDPEYIGGWADLEKLHEPTSVLMLALIWITTRLAQVKNYKIWGIAAVFAAIAMALFNPAMAVFAVAYLGLAMTYYFIRQERLAALWMACTIAALVAVSMMLLVINYVLTGLPSDQGLFGFWPYINFNKIDEWGTLFELLTLHWLRMDLVAHQVPLSINFLFKVMTYVRLNVWGLVLVLAVVVFGMGCYSKSRRVETMKNLNKPALLACVTFLLLIMLLALVVGREQPISFFRFTIFTYAPMLCVCLLLVSAAYTPVFGNRKSAAWSIFLVLFIFSAGWLTTIQVKHRGKKVGSMIANGMRFVSGQYSIADAYRNQRAWPGRMEWGGIYPAVETIWRMLPPKTRVWSMHIHSYCMLPDCHMEGFMSFRLSPYAETIYFGDPQAAKEILKKENLNYFFIANSLELTDPLPLAPLFSPELIANYLGIAWTDGDNTLLTWKEESKAPLDAAWLQRYRQKVASSKTVQTFPYADMKMVMTGFRQDNKNKIEQTSLPWTHTRDG